MEQTTMRRAVWRMLAGCALAVGAGPAMAQDLRELCPSRPGLGTPPCTVDAGHLLAEVGLADWTLDRQPDARTDTILAGDILLHYGIGPSTEIQFGLTSYGHERMRDRASGEIGRAGRVGDAIVQVRQNFANPDGKGFSIAAQPFATLPVGRSPIGAGDWGAGLLVPVSYDLNETVQLQATPEVDAAVDEDGHGRHLAYSAVAGVAVKLSEAVTTTIEGSVERDRDPEGHETLALAAVALAWQAKDDLQLDVGSAFGLNRQTPDARLYLGVTERF